MNSPSLLVVMTLRSSSWTWASSFFRIVSSFAFAAETRDASVSVASFSRRLRASLAAEAWSASARRVRKAAMWNERAIVRVSKVGREENERGKKCGV